jgi:hypothetical protein
MSDLTVMQNGSFTSTGNNFTINLRTGTSWMQVWNLSAINAGTFGVGYKWEWNIGMGGVEYQANGGGTAVDIIPNPDGFLAIDSSMTAPLAPIAITGSSNVVRPIIQTANTAGLATDSTVLLYGVTGQPNLSSYQFTIDTVVANTSFRIKYALANAPGAVGTAGFYRIIPFNPIFEPTRRFVVNITRAAQAVVTTGISHGYAVGEAVRFYVWPDEGHWGMPEIDQLIGNVTSIIDEGNFTVDIDTTAFTPFTFPLPAAYPFTRAQVVPVGEQADATASNPNLLDDSITNTAILGMTLVGGADNPGGTIGDVMYWLAGRTENFPG